MAMQDEIAGVMGEQIGSAFDEDDIENELNELMEDDPEDMLAGLDMPATSSTVAASADPLAGLNMPAAPAGAVTAPALPAPVASTPVDEDADLLGELEGMMA